MATIDYGKIWEDTFKKDWSATFPNTFIFRLKDQMTGYYETSKNPCDFLCFPNNGKLYLMECKSHKGISIPFGDIPQYDRLLDYKDTPNIVAGVVVWFYDFLKSRHSVIFVSIQDMEKMVLAGEKSIGLRMLKEKDKDGNLLYNIIEIPIEMKRKYFNCDYSILKEI